MGKSGAWKGADQGFIPSPAASLCDLGCSVQSQLPLSHLGKEEMSFYSSSSTRLLEESKPRRLLRLEGMSILESGLYSLHHASCLKPSNTKELTTSRFIAQQLGLGLGEALRHIGMISVSSFH